MGILRFFSLQFKMYYTRLEEFVLKGEQDQGMRLKIKMSLYIAHLLIAYFVLIPFINPYVPLAKMIVSLIGVIGHIFVLRVRNVYLTALYFIFSSIMSQYASTKNHIEFLRVIGVVLIQHNHSLLLSKHKLLNITLGVVTIALVNTTQKKLDELIEDNNLLKIIDAIRNLQYSWPLMFFFNQFSMIHLTEQYCNAIQQSQNTQTELQRKNQELFEVNEKLKKTLSLLEKTNKDLKDAINARELFIASVSHELRNPLNAMVGNIELLGFEVKDPRWLKMLETCKTCGEVLLGLINNVLDVAKINAERLELNCQPGNLYKLIEKVWTVSTIKMRQKGIKGHLLIGNNVPTYIEMDNHRLNQILLNLIGNATKFTSDGFVKVVISWVKDGDITDLTDSEYGFEEIWKSRSRQSMLKPSSSYRNLDVPSLFGVNLPQPQSAQDCKEDSILLGSQNTLNRTFDTKFFSYLNFRQYTENDSKIKERTPIRAPQASKERGVLRIEIIDSGCGISETAIPHLFQAFSQADSSITRHFGGTGLGLYITKQLVQKMEGQIYVKSKKDTGSIFWMGIPARTATKEEEIKEREIEDFSGLVVSRRNSEVLKALIVDDDPLNQMIMTNYLEKLGMQSEIAGNGQEAVDKFKSREIGYYCLVTMDLQMPIMDGLTASKAIRRYERQIKAHQSVPIIVVTGNCIDMDKSQCMSPVGEIRASYFFRKPFTFEECKSSIKTILQKNWNGDTKQNRRIKVLIADDDSFNTAVLKEYLETSAFECEVCTNGKEAVDLTQAKHFDVILMDCEMPTMDGYTAASQIRAKNKNILIIGVTGNLREDCIQKAREKGMDDVETKPVHFQKLIERLNNILRI